MKSCFGISQLFHKDFLFGSGGDVKQERGQTPSAWLRGSFGAALAGEVADSRGVRGGREGLPTDPRGQVRFRASCLRNCALEKILGGGKRSRQDGGRALRGPRAVVTSFPGQEPKAGRQPCHLPPGPGQEWFQRAPAAAPDTSPRLLPPFLWSRNPQVPWEASPDVTECAAGTAAHCWETAVGICQGKNYFCPTA